MKIWNDFFANKIKAIEEKYNNSWVSNELHSQYEHIKGKYNKVQNEFNYFDSKLKKWKYFFLPLTLWTKKKKYNEIKNSYSKIVEEFLDVKNEKIKLHELICNSDVFGNFFNDIFSIFKVQYEGMPNTYLIEKLNLVEDFKYSDFVNPSYSSWFIYDKNKILVDLSKQRFNVVMREYTGSKTIKIGDEYVTITATYQHPEPQIWSESKTYLFVNELNKLDFFYRGLDPKFFRKARLNKDEVPFENNDFEKTFDWTRTNEQQMRMLFTPLAQETYIEEVKSYNDNGKIKFVKEEDQYKKEKNFLFNLNPEKSFVKFSLEIKKIFLEFITNSEYEFNKFINDFKDFCLNWIYNFFQNTKYLYMFESFVSSIDQSYLISEIKKHNSYDESSTAFFVLSRIIRKNIVYGFTKTFRRLISLENINDIYIASFNNFAYNRTSKTIYVYESGVDVPVNYYDYDKIEKDIQFCYSFLKENNNDFFRPIDKLNRSLFEINKFKNIKVKELCEQALKEGIEIYIENNIISAIAINETININDLVVAIKRIKELY